MQSEHFIFNNIKSIDMDQYLIRTKGGAVSTPFFGGQSIKEDHMKGRITPYHTGTELDNIEFTIEISPLEKEWTPQRKNEIGKWLIHDTYKPFQTIDDLGKFYYAIVTKMPDFEMYGNQGFIPVTFRTNSAFAWSPVYLDEFDLSDNTTTTIIALNNLSNINRNYFPKIEIELVGTEKNVTLRNLSKAGEIFGFTNLLLNETVSVDNENEIIVSNKANSNPFEKFNRNWLELVYGVNNIEVTGKCKIWVKSQFPILQ